MTKTTVTPSTKEDMSMSVGETETASTTSPKKDKETPVIDFLINPARFKEREAVRELLGEVTRAMFAPSLLSSAYPALFRLLRHSRLPCSPEEPPTSPGHLLQRCSWAGRTQNCSSLFTPTITDLGICCSFNLQRSLRQVNCPARGEARDFPCLVKELQGEEGGGLRRATVGADMGLQVLLDQHSNLASPLTLHQPGHGFKVLLGQPASFPLLGQDALLLAPGQQHQLRVAATVVRSTEAVASLDPITRKCLFPRERALVHHTTYSQASCLFECALHNASITLGHWFG